MPSRIYQSMNIAAKIKKHIHNLRLTVGLISHTPTHRIDLAAKWAKIPLKYCVKTYLLEDDKGLVACCIPADGELDIAKVNQLLARNLHQPPTSKEHSTFYDCESGEIPMCAFVYGITTIVDSKIYNFPRVYFKPGSHSMFLALQQAEFRYLMSGCSWGNLHSTTDVELCTTTERLHTTTMIQAEHLPPLPAIVNKIVSLSNAPNPDVMKLQGLLQHDSELLAAIGQYCQLSANGAKSSVSDFSAITHVVVGCAGVNNLNVSLEGPLGLKSFWQHAKLSSKLCYEFAVMTNDVDKDVAYLCGLLQNVGFLMLGHLYPPEFRLLNRWLSANPNASITQLEARLLGMGQAQHWRQFGHARMGSWLLQHWGMPDYIVEVVTEHHNYKYSGALKKCVAIVQLANACLALEGMGHDTVNTNSSDILSRCQLSVEAIEHVINKVFSSQRPNISNYLVS